MSKNFFDAVKERRTFYGIGKESVISQEKLQEIVNNAMLHSPTAFNSQSGRILLLIGEHHDKLWDLTKDILKKIVPEEAFSQTEEKINSFKAGYGTILFFEDQSIIKGLQEKFSLYKDNFPVWSLESSGMLQYIIWTALEAEGLGVSLQHYNPLIDDEVRKNWNVPESWKLLGEMPFGSITAPAGKKEYLPLDERVKIFK